MKTQVFLTNERIKHKFTNRFDLVNFAINKAQTEIRQEKEVTLSEIMGDLVEMPDVEQIDINK